jgi:DNA-binding FadR family transcriptional regulator
MQVENIREASNLKAGEIVRFVMERVSSGDWPSGHRVPPEKILISQFSAARNTVRKALARLEKDGVIHRHVGRGTFIRGEEGSSDADIGAQIGDASPAEINELRVLLEPAVAEIAVARATETEIRDAQNCLTNTMSARTDEEYERWEAELHLVIISAAKNSILTRFYRSIHDARKKAAWKEIKRRSLDETRRAQYEADHAAMVEAFASRDAVALRRSLHAHLRGVSHNMMNPVNQDP